MPALSLKHLYPKSKTLNKIHQKNIEQRTNQTLTLNLSSNNGLVIDFIQLFILSLQLELNRCHQ